MTDLGCKVLSNFLLCMFRMLFGKKREKLGVQPLLFSHAISHKLKSQRTHFFANGRAAAEFLKAPSNLWLRTPPGRAGHVYGFQVQYVDAAILPMALNPVSILPSHLFWKASLQDFNLKFVLFVCVLNIAANMNFHATLFKDQ